MRDPSVIQRDPSVPLRTHLQLTGKVFDQRIDASNFFRRRQVSRDIDDIIANAYRSRDSLPGQHVLFYDVFLFFMKRRQVLGIILMNFS